MSEHITHVALFEDCMRLALRSDDVSEPLKISLRNYPDLAKFGASRAAATRLP